MKKILFISQKSIYLLFVTSVILFFSFTLNADTSKIKTLGNKRISNETVVLISGLGGYSEISDQLISDALRKLTKSGLFSNVRIKRENDVILVEVKENPLVNEILFEGNKVASDDELLGLISSKVSNAYSKETVLQDVKRLTQFYKSRGRYNAVIKPQFVNTSGNLINLIFEIIEGDLLEVKEVVFVGNKEFSDKKLFAVTPSRKKGIFSFITDSDNYSETILAQDKIALEKFYRSNGYIDIQVTSSLAILAPDKTEVTLSYTVSEGPKYLIGEIDLSSKISKLDEQDYRSLINLRTGDVYNKNKLDELANELEQRIISSGVPLAKVRVEGKKTPDIGIIDVDIVFENNQKLFVERIEIRGNNQTLDEVIRREFSLAEGDAFNPLVLKKTEEKLRALGFFEQVRINVTNGTSMEKAIVIVEVLEAPTGSLNFGVGYSTDTSITGSLSLTERNLLGKGQKLNFNLSAAKSSQVLNFGFSEPAFLDRDVSAGINLAFKKVDPMESTYTSNSISLSPSFGFVLGPDAKMLVSYKIENLKINSNDSLSEVLKSDHGDYVDSSLTSTLVFDRRNSIVEPTSGYILRLSSTLAGLGGDIGYVKNALRSKIYKGVLEDAIVFSAELEGGILDNYRGFSRVTDRFKLGGRNFRGFQFGEIGPRDVTGDALGGEKYLMSRLEANFPLGLPEELGLYGGVFSELGSLWSLKTNDKSVSSVRFSEQVFRSSAGVSLYWSTPIGPLQFNWSKPIDYIEGVDITEAFSLNLATRF